MAAAEEQEEDEFGEGAAAAAAVGEAAALGERLVLLRPFFFLSVDDFAFFFLPPLPPPPLAVMREEKYELTDSSTAGVAVVLVVVAALGEEDDCLDDAEAGDDDVEAASALAESGLPLPLPLVLVIASPLPVSSPLSLDDDEELGPILPKIFLSDDFGPTENLCRPRPVTAARRSARDFRELAAMAASGDMPGVLGPSLLLGWAGVAVHVVVDACACAGDDSEDTALSCARAAGGEFFAATVPLGWPGGEAAPWRGLLDAPVAVHVPAPMGDLPSMAPDASIFGKVVVFSSTDAAAGAAAAGLRLLISKTISPSSEESSS